jgi:hypothetical protein
LGEACDVRYLRGWGRRLPGNGRQETGDRKITDFISEEFWEKCLARPKKEGVAAVLTKVCDYAVNTLSERIDKVEERGKGEGLSFFSGGKEFLTVNVCLRNLRVYVHPPAGAAFDPDAEFDVEKFRFWDSSYRKTTGKYVGMTVWVSEEKHLSAFGEIVNQIPGKV